MMGITPACAGKRKVFLLSGIEVGDHPRVCGEKHTGANGLNTKVGSPPRMRGKVYGATGEVLMRGITPAYAGKSVMPNMFSVTM